MRSLTRTISPSLSMTTSGLIPVRLRLLLSLRHTQRRRRDSRSLKRQSAMAITRSWSRLQTMLTQMKKTLLLLITTRILHPLPMQTFSIIIRRRPRRLRIMKRLLTMHPPRRLCFSFPTTRAVSPLWAYSLPMTLTLRHIPLPRIRSMLFLLPKTLSLPRHTMLRERRRRETQSLVLLRLSTAPLT